MYEDPDQPRLPTSLTDCNYEWKRPSEYLQEKNMADKVGRDSAVPFTVLHYVCVYLSTTESCDGGWRYYQPFA